MKGLTSLFGFVLASTVEDKLQFERSVGKRLDEHREVIERLEKETTFFQEYWWHIGHMATQDDYLMQLYHMVHGCYPDDSVDMYKRQKTGEYVRPRPAVLGPCQLPERDDSVGVSLQQ